VPFTYILECADGSCYVGSTSCSEIEERVRQHNADGLGGSFMCRRGPVKLLWAVSFDLLADAFAFENRIHGWSRARLRGPRS
jgi:putative endonuclease